MLAKTDAATVIAQVREVAEFMASGQWRPGNTEQAFAAKYGLSVASVRDRASEARRLVAHAFGDLEDLRGLILAQLDGIAGEQRTREPRVAVSALMAIAQIAGLVVTRHVDTRTTGTKTLTPAERLAEVARIRVALNDAEDEAQRELGTIDPPAQDED